MPRPPMGLLLSGGSPIDLDGSFFVQLTIFFAAFLILQHLVFRPVLALLDARENAMAGAKAGADAMERESEGKRTHLESELQRVRQAASADRDRLRTEAQSLARKLAEAARRETAATMEAARERLGREAADVRARALAEAPALAARIAERLLGRSAS